jgi:hypothetical protein
MFLSMIATNILNRVSAFVRSEEGKTVQQRLWDETFDSFRAHVPADQLNELLAGLK